MNFGDYFTKNIYANRGMTLEEDINLTNDYYNSLNIALVYKKPTPIKVVQVEYPKNKIKEAYFNEPSTLDYNGIYKGKYIEFDAKETTSKTSFPLSNIHKHQMKHIERVLYFGGVSFLIVRFVPLNLTYFLLGEDIITFEEKYHRKSIPLDFFKKYGFLIDLKYSPRLDYIKILDIVLKRGVKKNEIEEEKEKD